MTCFLTVQEGNAAYILSREQAVFFNVKLAANAKIKASY
jgi:hypothetical protein